MRQIIHKTPFLEFIGGLLFSFILGIPITIGLKFLFEAIGIDMYFGGDKAFVFVGLFLGLPAGSISGIYLSEKLIFGEANLNTLGVVFGFLLNIGGGFLGLFMLDTIGGIAAFCLPLFVAFFSLVGLKVGAFLAAWIGSQGGNA